MTALACMIVAWFCARAPATDIGIFYDRRSGGIKYIINPDFEDELDNQKLDPNEKLLKVSKQDAHVSAKPNAMTLDDVARIIKTYSGHAQHR